MRLTVGTVVGPVAAGRTNEENLREYPDLEAADISEALSYAAWRAAEVEVSWACNEAASTGRGPGGQMTRGEKAQLLQHLTRDLGDAFLGIDLTDGVAGGDPCIARTRIPVWTLEQLRRSGASEAELLRSYPGLRAEDLATAWAYVRTHRDQIDAPIQENEAA